MAGVGAPPSYSAVEELKRRLRSVPETVITYFLVKCNGNLEECYEQLKDGNWREVDPYLAGAPQHPPGDYGPTHQHQQPPSHHSPPDSHTRTPVALQRLPTYGPGYTGTYSREHSHAQPASERLEETWPIPGATWSHDMRRTARPLAVPHPDPHPHHHPQPHPHPHPSPTKYPATSPEFHIDDHVGTQRMQLERFQKSRDELVHNLSVLKNDADGKKHRLSSLRLRVGSGPTHQDVNQIRDVITTLQYDIQQAKNKLELEKVQDVMKKNRDIYTEEGVRWQCGHCTFLNHPLMTRCESCDLPKMSSSKPRTNSVTS